MRIAIISDVHGNFAALEAVLKDLDRTKPDQVVNLGDLIFRGPQPAECLAALDKLGAATIRGNTDEWLVDGVPNPALQPYLDYTLRHAGDADLVALKQLPFAHELNDILCVHGSPRSNSEFLLPWSETEDPTILDGVTAGTVACGHQHQAYQYRTKSGHLILSAGSVGLPFDGDPRAAYTLVDLEPGRTAVTSIRVDYDRQGLLALAESRGYPDMAWLSRVLLTGRS